MTYQPWYTQTDDELREAVIDPVYRANVEKRLAELKSVNEHGDRCVMSKEHQIKLERALA